VYSMLQTKKAEGMRSPPPGGKETEIEAGASLNRSDRGRAKSFGAADAPRFRGLKLLEPANSKGKGSGEKS
jgi:hypothetical protein